jgi:hypothetical protein
MDGSPAPQWPADVIHVNEDGWVLINRGRRHGLAPGLRLLVVSPGARELRDLFMAGAAEGVESPVVLRTRRTYELLEVVHVEEACAVAVASRAPAARRPEFYTGHAGELLVWVPLPADYTWPPRVADDEVEAPDAKVEAGPVVDQADNAEADPATSELDDETGAEDSTPDEPPETGNQEDERWEEALPLNGVQVGDIVVPAIPAATSMSVGAHVAASGTPSTAPGSSSASPDSPWDRSYDWMQTPYGQ